MRVSNNDNANVLWPLAVRHQIQSRYNLHMIILTCMTALYIFGHGKFIYTKMAILRKLSMMLSFCLADSFQNWWLILLNRFFRCIKTIALTLSVRDTAEKCYLIGSGIKLTPNSYFETPKSESIAFCQFACAEKFNVFCIAIEPSSLTSKPNFDGKRPQILLNWHIHVEFPLQF